MRHLYFLLLVWSLLLSGCGESKDDAGGLVNPGGKPQSATEPNDDPVAVIKKLGGEVTFDERNPGKPIIGVDLEETKVTDAGLVRLKGLTSLKELYLSTTEATDAGLEHLKGLTSLETLYLADTQVTDAGLVHLKGLTNLQTLILDGTETTDAGLAHLKGLTSLETLYLEDTKVTDAGLVDLKGLSSLRTLGLGPQVTESGVEDLQSALPKCAIHQLEREAVASIEKSGGTGNFSKATQPTKESQAAAVAAIKALGGRVTFDEKEPSESVVGLSGNKVTDAGLVPLKGLMSLRKLYLMDTLVTDAVLDHLKEMTGLQGLELLRTKVTNAGLVHIKDLTSLEVLSLYETEITEAGLVHLKDLTSLHTLALGDTQVRLPSWDGHLN